MATMSLQIGLGGNVPILGSNNRGFSPLGKGMQGFIPQAVITTDTSYPQFEMLRYEVVEAWNNVYKSQIAGYNATHVNKIGRVITPFRAVNNAGDILSRQYYSCGGGAPTQGYTNVYGIGGALGGHGGPCDNTYVPAANCNVKYVYDSSNYTYYLKQQAIAKTYNLLTNGGDQSNGSQSSIGVTFNY